MEKTNKTVAPWMMESYCNTFLLFSSKVMLHRCVIDNAKNVRSALQQTCSTTIFAGAWTLYKSIRKNIDIAAVQYY